jgi:hypothetical protein
MIMMACATLAGFLAPQQDHGVTGWCTLQPAVSCELTNTRYPYIVMP